VCPLRQGMKPRVVYWNNMPTPYMVERFNAAASNRNFDFEAWFSTRVAAHRTWNVDESTWRFRYRYLPSIGRGEHPLAFPAPLLGSEAPDLVVSLYASTAFLFGWRLARLRGARTAFWAEVTFDSWVRRRRWKETLKKIVLPRADAILTAGRDGADFVKRYGVPDDRIFIVPHVIDFERYAQASAITPGERQRIRDRLGLHGTTFVYVGRLWRGKGVAYLIDAFASLQRTTTAEVSLLLVGDGPDEEWLRTRCEEERTDNVAFAGFHQADTLPALFAAGDVFVFPTLGDPFGMVVPEAMACGLPVISTSAAGELHDRVIDCVNGFVVAPADSAALVAPMRRLVDDPELLRAMSDAARRTVEGQRPEMWAEAFDHAVTSILARSDA
jgi:glycosyltransferase involved in cell wall biosynthesis